MQLLSIFAQNLKVRFVKYALKLQCFGFIVVFSLNCIATNFVTDLLRFNVIYDATVALHYTAECRSLVIAIEILVP